MIITADKNRSDGVYFRLCEMIKTDLPILLLSRVEELELNEQVYELKGKPFIIFDVIENGWNVEFEDTLVVGKNTFSFFNGIGWERLHNFLKDNEPVLYFKRELLQKDVTETLVPCEYPNWQEDYPLQLKSQFNGRPISAFHYWGRSHEARLMLHGEIWKHAARKGYAVCDNVFQLNQFMQNEANPNRWVTLHMPHYSRVELSELMKVNAMSKLSVSLFGCGRKCFRNTGESIVNSICVMPEDGLAYSMPFIHGKNSIKFNIESIDGITKEWDVVGAIEEALKRDDLYDIYLESKKLSDWYMIDKYVKNYLEPLINKYA